MDVVIFPHSAASISHYNQPKKGAADYEFEWHWGGKTLVIYNLRGAHPKCILSYECVYPYEYELLILSKFVRVRTVAGNKCCQDG